MRAKKPIWIHQDILFNPEISAPTIRVLAAIGYHCGEKDHTWISQAKLAAEIGMGKNAIAAHLQKLEIWGVLKRQVWRQDGARTRYVFTMQAAANWTLPDPRNRERETDSRSPKQGPTDPRNRDRPIPETGIGYIGKNIRENHKRTNKAQSAPVRAELYESWNAPEWAQDWHCPTDPIPDDWCTEQFLEIWWEFWTDRQAGPKSKRPTPNSMKRSRQQLAKWPSHQAAIDHMTKAHASRWSAFFAPQEWELETLGVKKDSAKQSNPW